MEWRRLGPIAELKTPWIGLVGERWEDCSGKTLDYWRVTAAHSVIILPRLGNDFLLPELTFRPGVGRPTLDFPGGRLPEGTPPNVAAASILERELGPGPSDTMSLSPLTRMPLLVNSSASDQRLYGFLADLDPALDPGKLKPHHRYAIDALARSLLPELECLQCRALLLEYMAQS